MPLLCCGVSLDSTSGSLDTISANPHPKTHSRDQRICLCFLLRLPRQIFPMVKNTLHEHTLDPNKVHLLLFVRIGYAVHLGLHKM